MMSFFVLACLLLCGGDGAAQQARQAWAAGQRERALLLASEAVQADPKNPAHYLLRGQMYDALEKYAEAVADCDACLRLDPAQADALDLRGSAQFKRGKFAESVADFDRFLQLRPKEAPGHWRRGISLFYAGKFAEGRNQFKGYESVDTNDVENAIWHFLCAAQAEGIAKARQGLLMIGNDRRVPMMEVYELFQGKRKPEDVLAAAEAGAVPAPERKQRLFYANLYLALYHHVHGDLKTALKHAELAADKYQIGQYMGPVARVEAEVLRQKQK